MDLRGWFGKKDEPENSGESARGRYKAAVKAAQEFDGFGSGFSQRNPDAGKDVTYGTRTIAPTDSYEIDSTLHSLALQKQGILKAADRTRVTAAQHLMIQRFSGEVADQPTRADAAKALRKARKERAAETGGRSSDDGDISR